MKIKVCGMIIPDNIRELSRLPIDLMGLIFYPESPRYIGDLDSKELDVLPENIGRVGVFVNESAENIVKAVDRYKLDVIQLHGNESPRFCRECLNMSDVEIIKAFSIAEVSDFDKTREYEDVCNYFLFDTKTPQYGGSGKKFDWSILNEYKGNTPFFLSGGISHQDALLIRKLEYNRIAGLDLNSKFEIEPGIKDIELLEQFIKNMKS